LHPRRLIYVVAAALVAAMLSVGAASAAADSLTGDGSTLVAPIMAEWAQGFQSATGNSVNYTPVGSGQGIRDISQRLVDFGASDAPLTPSQFSGCGGCFQIPWGLSAVGLGYHINGVGRNLRLTGPVAAQIYLGQITRWNDPRIRALNPGVRLPGLRITPIFRSDGSGTTYAFANYLSAVNRTWRSRIGFSTSIGFPVGVGGKGNAGVTAILQSTNGGISYAEVAYLIGHALPAAAVQNAAGRFVYPNLSNIESAARTLRSVPSNNEMHIVNPPRSARNAYPISTFTYGILPASSSKGGLLKAFVNYVLGAGQAFGPGLDFAPIPPIVARASRATLNRIQ
jgi:phosphate transport system substrate-binding protein